MTIIDFIFITIIITASSIKHEYTLSDCLCTTLGSKNPEKSKKQCIRQTSKALGFTAKMLMIQHSMGRVCFSKKFTRMLR